MIDVRRGDVVLVGFPFAAGGEVQRTRRLALVVPSDRYNRRRAAVILAAITGTRAHRDVPSKVAVGRDSLRGARQACGWTASWIARRW